MTLATARQRLALLGYEWNVFPQFLDFTGVKGEPQISWAAENVTTGEMFTADTLDLAVNSACETEPSGLAELMAADGQFDTVQQFPDPLPVLVEAVVR